MGYEKEYKEYLAGKCENYNQSLICALEEMKNGGKGKIMVDKRGCACCSAEAAEGSTLCADCLAVCDVGRKTVSGEVIKLQLQLKLQRRLLQHVFVEYQRLLMEKKGEL